MVALWLPKATKFELVLTDAAGEDILERWLRTRILWILVFANLGWVTLVRVLLGDWASQSPRPELLQGRNRELIVLSS